MSEVKPDVKPDDVDPDVKQEEPKIPYARFKEVNTALQDTQAKLAEILAEKEEERKKELEKQGEYKKLLEETEAEKERLAKQAAQWEQYQASRREVLLSKLPEDKKERYASAPLDILEGITEDFLNIKPNVPTVDGSPPSGDIDGYKTPQEAAADLRQGIITRETFDKIIRSFRRKVAG